MKQISSALRITGGVLLAVSLIFCTWIVTGAVAYGWISHADHYGGAFRVYGILILVCCALLTAGAVLYFCRLNLLPAILGGAALLGMLCILLPAMSAAEQNGWSGQTAESFGRQASVVWRNGILRNLIPAGLLLLLSLTRFFSYDAAVRRRKRREKQENTPAPSILGDDS
jgi:hypothetical protein